MMIANRKTHVVIGAPRDGRDVNDLATEILFNLSNKQIYIPNSAEGAVAAADQGEELLAIEVAAIRHLRPIVTDVHDGMRK